MRLITLNTWGGRVREPFIEFIKRYRDTDIFCFQEIYDNAEEVMKGYYPDDCFNIFTDLKELLPQHHSFFRPVVEGVYGVAVFIKNQFHVSEEGELIIHESKEEFMKAKDGHHSRNLQWAKLELGGKELTVLNVHGLWNGQGKSDTPERVAQSERIKEFVDSIAAPKILCGDFNLLPDTKSIEIIESAGMINLVKEYGVTSTRTELYTKELKFADYIFVTPNVHINDFKVLADVVSDHSPLYLDFEIK